MCIRDRDKATIGYMSVRTAPTRQQVAEAEAFYRRLKQGTACLLYTSDAADERSSVDLGGRRIIKKKKSETLQYIYVL